MRASSFNLAVPRDLGIQFECHVPKVQSLSLSSSRSFYNNTPIWVPIRSVVPHPLAFLLRTLDVGVPNDICGFVPLRPRWLRRFVIIHPLDPSIARLVAWRGPGARDAAHFSRSRPQMKSRSCISRDAWRPGPGETATRRKGGLVWHFRACMKNL